MNCTSPLSAQISFPSASSAARGGTAHARKGFRGFSRADELRQRRIKRRDRVAERLCKRVAAAARMLRRGRAAAGQECTRRPPGASPPPISTEKPRFVFSYGRHRRADPADRTVFPGTAAQCREHRGRLPAAG